MDRENGRIDEAARIAVRYSEEKDLDYVLKAEKEEENARFVGQWSKEEHRASLEEKDILHILFEEKDSGKPVGYAILAGLAKSGGVIEFRRIVITEKGKGYGREALRLIKKMAFKQLGAHRLWLDVREQNSRAQHLYGSEGFVKEGMLRECVLTEEGYESLLVMSILENEYGA